MPIYIPCANTFCDEPVTKLGDICETCKEREHNQERDRRHRGWTRYSDNRSAKPGHKGGKDSK